MKKKKKVRGAVQDINEGFSSFCYSLYINPSRHGGVVSYLIHLPKCQRGATNVEKKRLQTVKGDPQVTMHHASLLVVGCGMWIEHIPSSNLSIRLSESSSPLLAKSESQHGLMDSSIGEDHGRP